MKILYTAEAEVTGGREGHGRTLDGRLDVKLSVPASMGGTGGPGTNPEQLFAIAFAACFQSTLLNLAAGAKVDLSARTRTRRAATSTSRSRWMARCFRNPWRDAGGRRPSAPAPARRAAAARP